jgi:hypothetical protein
MRQPSALDLTKASRDHTSKGFPVQIIEKTSFLPGENQWWKGGGRSGFGPKAGGIPIDGEMRRPAETPPRFSGNKKPAG